MSTSDNRRGGTHHEWRSASVTPIVALISGRWALPILHALENGPLRRNALRERVGAVSDKVLTERSAEWRPTR
jgi:DNA-binding HxlR family transcriptional regulator